ncbi:MAG: methyltransferase [Pseudomonadota bacterium]
MERFLRVLFSLTALAAILVAGLFAWFAWIVVDLALVPAWQAGLFLPTEAFRLLNVEFSGWASVLPVVGYGAFAVLFGALACVQLAAISGRTEGWQARAWWCCKVQLSLLIVSWAVFYQALHPETGPRLPIPPVAAQGLALLGAGVIGTHYLLLRSATAAGALERERGLFRIVRHPMYLGDLGLYGGLALIAADGVALLLLALFATVQVRLVRAEDRALAKRFGSAWSAWADETGGLFPRRRRA